MELIPAIDLLDGNVVRLRKGRYEEVTVYSEDPIAQAEAFAAAGAERLHIVDLEGARSGAASHAPLVRRILEGSGLRVQVGGGVRDLSTAEAWLEAGAERVVFGTAAVRAPEVVRAFCERHPGRAVIALDARGDEVAVAGWKEGSGRDLGELAEEVSAWGIGAILYTDIERDGTSEGPAVEATAALQARIPVTVIASGGIGRLEDLAALSRAGVRAAVCGRALYEGAFALEEAFALLRGEGR